MTRPVSSRKNPAASIPLGDETLTIERLPVDETGQEQIRFTVWSGGEMHRPICLSEEELVALLQAAIEEHVVSLEFIAGLHRVIEI